MRMDEWRTWLGMVQDWAGSDAPVLVRSAVVQSAVLDWKSGPTPDSYLFAPLTAYPVPNEIIPVPFFVDGDAERYLEQEIQRRAAVHRQRRSEEHTSELQSHLNLVCRLLLEKKKIALY